MSKKDPYRADAVDVIMAIGFTLPFLALPAALVLVVLGEYGVFQ